MKTKAEIIQRLLEEKKIDVDEAMILIMKESEVRFVPIYPNPYPVIPLAPIYPNPYPVIPLAPYHPPYNPIMPFSPYVVTYQVEA